MIQYKINEMFETIQGEGSFTGQPSIFIRLQGCPVGCSWCDTKHTWEVELSDETTKENMLTKSQETSQWTELDVAQIQALVTEQKYNAKHIVITGGEPAMHDLTSLTKGLQSVGLRTHIETSGTHALTGDWDWVTFSPKRFKAPLDAIYDQSHELKVVVVNRHDLKWGEEHALRMPPEAVCYFQPEWDRREKVLPHIMEHLRIRPNWRISLQTHKYLGLP